MGVFRDAVDERPEEDGMGADAAGQRVVAGVGDARRDAERAPLHRVDHLQPERKGIDRARRGVVGEGEGDAAARLFRQREAAVAGKAVLGDRVVGPAVVQPVTRKAADDRKQHGSMPRPLRARLPDQFEPIGVFQGAQFGPIGFDGRRYPVAADCKGFHVHALPRRNAVCSGCQP